MPNRIPSETLNVVLLYSDRASVAPAVAALQRVQDSLSDPDFMNLRLWRLDLLERAPELREAIDDEVVAANMIVVPTDDRSVCSEAFRSWAEKWPARSNEESCSLVGFQARRESISPVDENIQWLRELAAQKGMDFLVNEAPEVRRIALSVEFDEAAKAPLALVADHAKEQKSFPGASAPQSLRGYGINE